MKQKVSIHAPLARSNFFRSCKVPERIVSIHAPLARSNATGGIRQPITLFQYMLLLRGATADADLRRNRTRFQYMLLLRGATFEVVSSADLNEVSIHAPLARSNPRRCRSRRDRRGFNTCSSCEEQLPIFIVFSPLLMFQYMLLLRGATFSQPKERNQTRFNTCSSCEEQLGSIPPGIVPESRFNTCSSCEEQPDTNAAITNAAYQFQYMLLLRGATCM